jgi:hypothetical protein
MTKYLISFPGSAMDISGEDMTAVGEAAHAVIREAKDAGVAVQWAAKIAKACRCSQELREFGYDPES